MLMNRIKVFALSLFVTAMMLFFINPTAAYAGDEALWMRYPAISPDGQTIAFSYQGDLFTVPRSGGKALALTRHQAYDFKPVWSPDGKTIVFASNRFGQFDLFKVPANGGKAQRLTFHSSGDVPDSFTADGKYVLFESVRMDAQSAGLFPTGALAELYKVDIDGGRPEQVLTTPAHDAVFDRAGQWLVYHDRKGYENNWRKHDTSAFARDIWLYDSKTGTHKKLTDYAGDDRNPVWSTDETSIYFLSEKSGSFNVWKMDRSNPAQREQVTAHKSHPVRFLTASSKGDLCYGYHGEIYLLPAGSNTPVKVSISIPVDATYNQNEFMTINSGATDMSLSPNGKEIAFIARGEVFVTSVDHATTKRITDTPEQERSISFSPDGKKLLFAAEIGNSWSLYQAELSRPGEKYFHNATVINVEPLLKTDKETFQPAYSPDGKEVAFFEERTVLKVLNLADKKVRKVMDADKNYSYIDGDQWFQWSPDSKWFLVRFSDRGRWIMEVGLVHASGKEPIINLTNSGYVDIAPKWGMKGKMMYWITNRRGMRSHGSWGSQADVYGLFFTQKAFDRFNLSKEELELLTEQEKEKKGDDKKSKSDDKGKSKDKKKADKQAQSEPLKIDLKNIEDRMARLTLHSSNLADAELSPDGEKLIYLCRFEKGFDLWINEIRERKTRLLAKLNARGGSLLFDKKGKNVFVLTDGRILKVDVNSGKQKPVSFNGEMRLRKEGERAYLFEHIWRQVLKKFYVKDLHGVDWDFYKKEYRKFLPYITNNFDFAEMLSEMLGELNASHTGARYRYMEQNADNTASLGLFYDDSYSGPGLKVKEVIEKGPLDKADSKVKPGVIITKINGIPIDAGKNYFPLLNRMEHKNVLLSLSDPANKTEWEERVKPVNGGQIYGLLYDRWVKQRREMTEKLSGGRLGYVHVRSMNDSSFRVVYSEVLGRNNDKEGIVIDTRFNGGGNLHDDLANFFNGKQYLTYVPRGQVIATQPIRRWTKKSIVVMDEGNYSDAHMFPYAYRALGIGKLVGMPVPGTGTSVWWETLQDRSLVFGIPQIGYIGKDGKYLENNQVEPDYMVDNDPESVAKGQDKQLEKAIEVLLKEIDNK